MAAFLPVPASPAGNISFNRVEVPSEEHEELNKMAHDVSEALSEEVFSAYTCNSLSHMKNVQKHPGDIVEAGSLAAQALPEATYPIEKSIPEDIIGSGKISDLQLEGILYSCQRHQVISANGERTGFFIGDGAGVGKGRQVSGIILDNFSRGRTRHIWFSISSDLRLDAERDLQDIGCFIKVIDGCQQLDKETRVFGLPSDFKEGVVFSTYATLVSSVQRLGSRQSRLQQLIDWCGGKDFDGCLIFDECHKAKHYVPGNEKTSTKVALAVTTLQRMLPKARVVYCSATGVTNVKNMAFMERLGLWGEGTTFKTFESFLDGITKRGLGALEMLAMEMKAAGLYVSRGLSFRQTEFLTVEATLSEEQITLFDKAAHIWKELKKCLEIAVSRTTHANNRIWSTFWANHQRFFKQLCMSMKAPFIIEQTKEALNAGYCVVIGLQSTGEASLESEVSRSGGCIGRFVSVTEEILSRFISHYFPTEIQQQNGEVTQDEWCVNAKKLLQSFLTKIKFPTSPLDEIIDKLGGPSCVAEMTGRRGRIVRTNASSKPQYQTRESDSSSVDSLNIQEKNSFMKGDKLVAIISDAASTGISIHADVRAVNQRRRVHLTMELPWSADKAVQQLGRSHRSNQKSGPIYKLVTTNLGGERRFAATVAKRLQSLGALTKGDRRAATGADLSQFNFDTPYGRSALRQMYAAICENRVYPGVSLSVVLDLANITKSYDLMEFNLMMQDCLVSMGILTDATMVAYGVNEKVAGDVGRFLNRILGLSVEQQNLIFSYFSECLNAVTDAAKREGRYNQGVTDIQATTVKVVGEPQEVFTEISSGTLSTKHVILSADRGVPWDMVLAREQQSVGTMDGFYSSKKAQKGKRLYLFAVQKESSTHLFTITRPNTGTSPFEEEKGNLLSKYTAISSEDAEAGWKAQFERTKEQCIHGDGCKQRNVCRVGCRTTEIHLLCGRIIPLLSLLETTVARRASAIGLSKELQSLRIVRVELDNGRRLVGLRYPEPLIKEVSQLLQQQKLNTLANNVNMQMGIAPVIIQTMNQNTSSISVESPSPVHQRLLKKAITPPVTIKNFFKPCSQQKETERISESDEKHVNGAVQETKINDDGNVKRDSDLSKRKLSSKAVKRQAQDSWCLNNTVKRCKKQGDIMTSFQKTSSAKDESRTCPICQFNFGLSTNNIEINKHIDNCIIE